MAQTYAQLQGQIVKLQAEAQKLRTEEVSAVIARIREDIKAYEITAQDLFGRILGKTRRGKSRSTAQAKYADGTGNVWVGRGPRPQWLRDALAAGKKLEEFVFGTSHGSTPSAPAASQKKAAVKRVATKKAAAAKKSAGSRNAG